MADSATRTDTKGRRQPAKKKRKPETDKPEPKYTNGHDPQTLSACFMAACDEAIRIAENSNGLPSITVTAEHIDKCREVISAWQRLLTKLMPRSQPLQRLPVPTVVITPGTPRRPGHPGLSRPQPQATLRREPPWPDRSPAPAEEISRPAAEGPSRRHRPCELSDSRSASAQSAKPPDRIACTVIALTARCCASATVGRLDQSPSRSIPSVRPLGSGEEMSDEA